MAFTYLIGWSTLNKWYYGVSFSRKRREEDLWRTYFSSSNYVKQFRIEHGEPDVVQVRRTFCNKESAIEWESRVLRRMNVIRESRWLNRTDNKAIRNGSNRTYGAPWNKGKRGHKRSQTSIQKQKQTRTGVKRGPYNTTNTAHTIQFRGETYRSIDAARKATGASFYTIKRCLLAQQPFPSPST
jgi:hypothetical protein